MVSAKAKARRARDTRWLYRMERESLKLNKEANKDRPMSELRDFAIKVWKEVAPEGKKFPKIVAGQGTRYLNRWCSYCVVPDNDIVLARQHRQIIVVLHELTHALGALVHGAKFVKLYFKLLHDYAGYNRHFLQSIATERGISLGI